MKIARVERYGATSVIELIVADLSVRSYDIDARAEAEYLAQQINERLERLFAERAPSPTA